jgi:23S rRNA pseudouridine2457 synthase
MPTYLLFHKPYEVLSQFEDEEGRATLKEYIPIPDVYAAGRLDYRSEGLLLLTNDGPLSHRLTHPRYAHTKTYLAQVEGTASDEAIARLNQEIVLPDLQTRLPQVTRLEDPGLSERSKPVRDYHPTTWLRIVLEEGKKHQVRKMTAAVGYPTLRLVRVAIGSLELGHLKPGEWRFLSPDEIRAVRRSVGFRD